MGLRIRRKRHFSSLSQIHKDKIITSTDVHEVSFASINNNTTSWPVCRAHMQGPQDPDPTCTAASRGSGRILLRFDVPSQVCICISLELDC